MFSRSFYRVPIFILIVTTSVYAADPPSAVEPLMKLLQSGRLPTERVGTVVEMVGRRGNTHDLAYIFAQAVSPEGYTGEALITALRVLGDAARTRKVTPAGDLSDLKKLLAADQPVQVRTAAVELAGLWKVEAAAEGLRELALQADAPQSLRTAALDSLVNLGGKAAREAIDALTAEGRPQGVRYQGVAALARLDVSAAATRAAEVLAGGTGETDPAPLIEAFLVRQGGTDQLAAALAKQPPPVDVAKLVLRQMFAAGRNDKVLADVLSQAAGISTEFKPLSKAEVQQLVADVMVHGDPVRGEQIFRRADLSCMKCHAVSKAGGEIGPDLSAVGQSSPVDYLVNSILDPNQAIKEAYLTRVVLTTAGEVQQGIVVDRDEERVVLKDATGKVTTVPTADIEFEKAGQSLMPQGLTKFLTRSELVDLVRFLSELGKPGPYAIRTTPRMQRWRYLHPVPAILQESVPDTELYRDELVNAEKLTWLPTYGQVGGTLPLAELQRQPGQTVLYLRGEVDITSAGAIGVKLDAAEGTHVWIDEQEFGSQARFETDLSRGRHTVTLRIDTSQRDRDGVQLELFKPEGSSAEFEVVDGT